MKAKEKEQIPVATPASRQATAVACACGDCAECCKHYPGWFAPGEVVKAAQLKGMAVRDFVRTYLVVDYWSGGRHGDVYTLRPAIAGEPTGELAPFRPRPGRCVFLNAEDRCDIHEAKPYECATTSGCDVAPANEFKRKALMRVWARKRGVAEIAEVRAMLFVRDKRTLRAPSVQFNTDNTVTVREGIRVNVIAPPRTLIEALMVFDLLMERMGSRER